MKDTVRISTLISEEEKTRRQKTINFARGSVRYEGVILSNEQEALNERYINGELSQAEFSKMSLDFIFKRNTADAHKIEESLHFENEYVPQKTF